MAHDTYNYGHRDLPMKLKKVISGGQTGADQTGVECAADLGLETGGTMPKGFRTEAGLRPDWANLYGLVEHFDSSYVPRTRKNVLDANVTLWFGNTGSPGYYCTKKACKDYNKPFVENPTEFKDLIEYEVWNIAGNRASTNPDVVDLVKNAFALLREHRRHEWAYGAGPDTLAGNEDL